MKRVILFYTMYLLVAISLSSCEKEEIYPEHDTCDPLFDNGANSSWMRNEISDFNGIFRTTSKLSRDRLVRVAILPDYQSEPHYLFHEQVLENGELIFIFHLYDCTGNFLGKVRNSDPSDSFNDSFLIDIIADHGTGNYNVWPDSIEF